MDNGTLSNSPRARAIDFVGRMRQTDDGTVDPMRLGDWLRSCGLLKELKSLASIWTARPAVRVNDANFNLSFARTPSGYVNVPGTLHYELFQNLFHFGRRWPQRTAADRECARCRWVDNRSAPLSFGGDLALCRECEQRLGFRLEYWPSCAECGHPFPTATAGEVGEGRWADPIALGETLCGPCWLDSEYRGDHALMIEHVLRCETIECAATAVADAFDRDAHGLSIIDAASEHLWEGCGILELLRTETVTLVEAGTTIRQVAIQLGIESPARIAALRRRDDLWREERRGSTTSTLMVSANRDRSKIAC
jgi:hypothetical protein